MTRIPKQWRQTHAHVDRASQSRPSTMPAASFSHTPVRTATTARWLATGPTCSPTLATGPMSRLKMIETRLASGPAPVLSRIMLAEEH
jgi:hypothetical protein